MVAVLPAAGYIQFGQLRKQLGAGPMKSRLKRFFMIANRVEWLRSVPPMV